MSLKPKVSVIIATYNRASLVGEAIQSVLAQTLDDWELLVINDGSTDNTSSMLKYYDELDDRIQIINQVNRGRSNARNAGISLAKADYVCFLDDDDLWYPPRLEKSISYLENVPQLAFVYGQVMLNKVLENKKVKYPYKIPEPTLGNLFMECTPQINAVTIKKNILIEMKGFNPSLNVCEDYDLWLRVAMKYHYGIVTGVLGECLHHENSTIANRVNLFKSMSAVLLALRSDLIKSIPEPIFSARISALDFKIAKEHFLTKNYPLAAHYLLQTLWTRPWGYRTTKKIKEVFDRRTSIAKK